MIPGVDETLRINGRAHVMADPARTHVFASEKRVPQVIVEVHVEKGYLHSAKALMRSRLWTSDSHQDRSVLPTMAQMINDQTDLVERCSAQSPTSSKAEE